METSEHKKNPVDAYIEGFPTEVQSILQTIRSIIKEEAPHAVEHMAYGIPTYTTRQHLIHFAAFKRHIGLYPTPDGIKAFKDELAAYKNAKGSVQFPLGKEIPFGLIRRIVQYRVREFA